MNELEESKEILEQFYKEVVRQENTLGGGQKLGVGGTALNSLQETRILLGNPRDQMTRLTPDLFAKVGLGVNEIYIEQMHHQFNFYYMTLTVNLFGSLGVQFDDLICELDFGPKGECEPIIQALFPTSEWHDVLLYGSQLSLGLNSDLEWRAGVNLSNTELSNLTGLLSNSIIGNVKNKNDYKAWIVVPQFTFSIGRKEISAAGIKNSICRWTITKPELHKEDNIQFGVVFKVPKAIKSIELIGKVTAQPSLPWLSSNLRHLTKALPKRFIKVLEGKTPSVIGDREKWVPLNLPN